ncbi:MAG: hypothetical protein ACOY93_16350 [Bacillota bacterium]
MYTVQTFVHHKVFGDHLSLCKPLEYRKQDWQQLNKGKERSVRLIVRAMLGVPSAHLGENEHAMWCFQLPRGSLITLYLHRGTVTEIATRTADEEELQEAIDFLLEEIGNRLKAL